MGDALERAADDAGSRALLARADSIRVPRGFWDYSDPGRALAERFGASAGVRTCVAEIGVLQTTLLGAAARDIAEGRADVVLVAGAEARHRAQRAQQLGVEAPLTRARGRRARRGAAAARRDHQPARGAGRAAHAGVAVRRDRERAALRGEAERSTRTATPWRRSRRARARVAAGNPDAWDRTPHAAGEIRGPAPGNRMLAFPYTKLHTSQWNVDQAAGLILCSLERARALGLARGALRVPARGRRLEPHGAARGAAARSQRVPGFAHAGRRALAHAGLAAAELGPLELYSCFPVAVRAQARELGIDEARPLTVTGGMTFAGGPLNNFVLQALGEAGRRAARGARRAPAC